MKVKTKKVIKNKLGVVNTLYNNIRKKGEMNKKAGVKPEKPTKAMLKQDKLIAKNTKKK
jgi:hypothetical protein